MIREIAACLALGVVASAAAARSSTLTGKVVGVADGDTVTVLVDHHRRVRVRLHGVDCPEKKQAFGKRAKQLTSRLVFGKTVRVKVATTDRYGRTVGEVFVGDQSLNEALVKAGLAWWYKKYARRAKVLAVLEDEARRARRGLWADPNPTPPWTFRHRGRGLRCNVKSRVCHRAGCRHYRCKNCTATFGSKAAARKSGYRIHQR